MDTHENNYLENESNDTPVGEVPVENQSVETAPVSNQEPSAASQEYHNVGTGRKESPFADSPYVMNHSEQTQSGSGSYYQTNIHQQSANTQMPPVQRPPKIKKKKSGKGWRAAVAAVLAVALVGGSCAITAVTVNNRWEKKTDQMEQTLNQKIEDLQKRVNSSTNSGTSVSSNPVSSQEGGMTPGQVYAQNVNSVVAISNQATTNVYGQITETASSGSGFIISKDGYVVSNYHVVQGATTLTVITFDGTEYPAELIGYDQSNDVALLKVDATGLDPVTIGSSDDLIVGDQVVAIGNPLGELTSTLTVGYISAKDRTINTDGTYINMMQTDAAINSGNSGGPLFNMNGEVIGITTAKYSGSSTSGATIEGIGFAIPIDDVIGMVYDLQEYGYVTGAYLGVSVISLDASTADLYSLPTGSLVDSVVEGSCAEKAGVQVKDIIISLGSYEVASNTDLTRALRKFDAGDTTTITVYRSGQEIDLTITLDEKPAPEAETNDTVEPSDDSQMPSDGSYEEWYNYFAPFFGYGGR